MLFKYNLNGSIREFSVDNGDLLLELAKKLFYDYAFPYSQDIMDQVWLKSEKCKKIFEISISPADLSFEAIWNLYNKKVARADAEKSFAKLSETDKIKLFLAVPAYHRYLTRSKISQAYLATFINSKYYLDDFDQV